MVDTVYDGVKQMFDKSIFPLIETVMEVSLDLRKFSSHHKRLLTYKKKGRYLPTFSPSLLSLETVMTLLKKKVEDFNTSLLNAWLIKFQLLIYLSILSYLYLFFTYAVITLRDYCIIPCCLLVTILYYINITVFV